MIKETVIMIRECILNFLRLQLIIWDKCFRILSYDQEIQTTSVLAMHRHHLGQVSLTSQEHLVVVAQLQRLSMYIPVLMSGQYSQGE